MQPSPQKSKIGPEAPQKMAGLEAKNSVKVLLWWPASTDISKYWHFNKNASWHFCYFLRNSFMSRWPFLREHFLALTFPRLSLFWTLAVGGGGVRSQPQQHLGSGESPWRRFDFTNANFLQITRRVRLRFLCQMTFAERRSSVRVASHCAAFYSEECVYSRTVQHASQRWIQAGSVTAFWRPKEGQHLCHCRPGKPVLRVNGFIPRGCKGHQTSSLSNHMTRNSQSVSISNFFWQSSSFPNTHISARGPALNSEFVFSFKIRWNPIIRSPSPCLFVC